MQICHDTDFHLEGDRFLRAWGIAESCTSPVVSATAVDVITTATQTVRDSENEIKNEGSTLGGSAPAEIIFRGAVTDAAVYREWQMARDSEFYGPFYGSAILTNANLRITAAASGWSS